MNQPLPRPLTEVLRSGAEVVGAYVRRGHDSMDVHRFAAQTGLPPAVVRIVLSDMVVRGLISCTPDLVNPETITVTERGIQTWRAGS
jgi:DNA-binding IclR family transcriptional regulator